MGHNCAAMIDEIVPLRTLIKLWEKNVIDFMDSFGLFLPIQAAQVDYGFSCCHCEQTNCPVITNFAKYHFRVACRVNGAYIQCFLCGFNLFRRS